MAGDFGLQRQCQTCLAIFPTNDALRYHLEVYRLRERTLTLEIEKCRAHAAPIYDPNKLCESCQVNAALTVASSNVSYQSDGEKDNGKDSISETTATLRSLGRRVSKCPYYGCGKPFGSRKGLLKHFELHVDCNEVCVECFRRFTHVSALIKHAKTHTYSSDRKRRYMLGMCDELRDTAIMKLDQMIETLESSSNDADLKTPKRTLGETDLGQNSCPLRRVRARCKNGEALLDTTSEKAPQHVELQDKPFTSFELQPAYEAVDMFAPLLFHDCPPPPTDNFDPPFFEASSSVGYRTQLGDGDPVGFCADITDPIPETEFRFAWDGK